MPSNFTCETVKLTIMTQYKLPGIVHLKEQLSKLGKNLKANIRLGKNLRVKMCHTNRS